MNISGEAIVNRIYYLMKLNGETRPILADAIGCNKQIFTDWKSRNNIPHSVFLYRIAKRYGVTMEWLLTGDDKTLPDDIVEVIIEMQKLTTEQRKPIVDMVKSQVRYWINYFITVDSKKH